MLLTSNYVMIFNTFKDLTTITKATPTTGRIITTITTTTITTKVSTKAPIELDHIPSRTENPTYRLLTAVQTQTSLIPIVATIQTSPLLT